MITAAEAKAKSKEIKDQRISESFEEITSDFNKKISIAISVGRSEFRELISVDFTEILTEVRRYYTGLGYHFSLTLRDGEYEILIKWS
jgi:hypothetical protein